MAHLRRSLGKNPFKRGPETAAFIEAVRAGVRKLPGLLRRMLSSRDRQRLPKIRRGAEHVVDIAIAWGKDHPHHLPYGTNHEELVTAQSRLDDLRAVQHALGSASSWVADSIRKLETDLWMEAMTVYAILRSHEGRDESISGVLEEIRSAMKLGPRTQTHVMVPIEGAPRSKKEIKRRQLAAARRKAGLPPESSTS